MEMVQESLVDLASNPTDFLQPKASQCVQVLSSLQAIFGQVKLVEPTPSPLEKLLVDGFDVEQIWEQIHLVNTPLLAHVVKDISQTVENADTIIRNSATSYHVPSNVSDLDTDSVGNATDGNDFGESDNDSDASENDDGTASINGDLSEENSDEDALESAEDDLEPPANVEKKPMTRTKANRKKGRSSTIDDDFFRLSDMQSFLDAEDARELRRHRTKRDVANFSDDEETDEDEDDDDLNEVDMFGNIGNEKEDEAAKSMKYNDFFGDSEPGPADERRGSDEEAGLEDVNPDQEDGDDSSETSETEGAADVMANTQDGDTDDDLDAEELDLDGGATPSSELSRFERQQLRMQAEIAKLEEVNVGDKPWQLAGEVQAGARPLDSLLQEDLDFDVTTAPAPDITEEVTQSLEDKIKQRIRDHVFDDVERKVDPKRLNAYAPGGGSKVELNSEQSTVGLGDIYADEYQRKSNNITTSAAEEKLTKDHEEINAMLGDLYTQLNALTNFNYTPRVAEIDVQTISNIPVIAMEEATPGARDGAAGVGGTTRLAPEEVHDKQKKEGGVAKADGEKSKTDKKRERRAKKKTKHLKRVATETKEREKANAGVQMSKKAALKKLAGDKNTTIIKGDRKRMSSAAVFKELGQPTPENSSSKKRKKQTSAGSAFRL